MRLSEAILLGSTLGPQHFGDLFDPTNPTSTCALGAALLATNKTSHNVATQWAFGIRAIDNPPIKVGRFRLVGTSLFYVVVRLNDIKKWPRERIAEWVATVERDLIAQGIDVEQTPTPQPTPQPDPPPEPCPVEAAVGWGSLGEEATV
jgi:hypothetical protein